MAQRSRRLRKKLRIDEFQELGFELSWNFPAGTAEEQIDRLIDALILEVIEARQLAFAGNGHLGWKVWSAPRRSASAATRTSRPAANGSSKRAWKISNTPTCLISGTAMY